MLICYSPVALMLMCKLLVRLFLDITLIQDQTSC